MIRIDETAVSDFELVHATIRSAPKRMAIPGLPVEPEPEFINCSCGSVLGTSNTDKEHRYQ
jgi:hypothetical protein